jgi:hypothetical protein
VIAESPVGQAPQALVYVPNAIAANSEGANVTMTTMPVAPDQAGRENLRPLALAGQSTQLWLVASDRNEQKKLTSV